MKAPTRLGDADIFSIGHGQVHSTAHKVEDADAQPRGEPATVVAKTVNVLLGDQAQVREDSAASRPFTDEYEEGKDGNVHIVKLTPSFRR